MPNFWRTAEEDDAWMRPGPGLRTGFVGTLWGVNRWATGDCCGFDTDAPHGVVDFVPRGP